MGFTCPTASTPSRHARIRIADVKLAGPPSWIRRPRIVGALARSVGYQRTKREPLGLVANDPHGRFGLEGAPSRPPFIGRFVHDMTIRSPAKAFPGDYGCSIMDERMAPSVAGDSAKWERGMARAASMVDSALLISLLTAVVFSAGDAYFKTFHRQLGLPHDLLPVEFSKYAMTGIEKPLATMLLCFFISAILTIVTAVLFHGLARRFVGQDPGAAAARLRPLHFAAHVGTAAFLLMANDLAGVIREIPVLEDTLLSYRWGAAVSALIAIAYLAIQWHGNEIWSHIQPAILRLPIALQGLLLASARNVPKALLAGWILMAVGGVVAVAEVEAHTDALEVLIGKSSQLSSGVLEMTNQSHELNGQAVYLAAEVGGMYHVVKPACGGSGPVLVMSLPIAEIRGIRLLLNGALC